MRQEIEGIEWKKTQIYFRSENYPLYFFHDENRQ